MVLTSKDKQKYLDALVICSGTGRVYDIAKDMVNDAFIKQLTVGELSDILRNFLKRYCLKQIENAAGTPEIKSDISSIKIKDKEQQIEIDALKTLISNMVTQINNIIENNYKLTSQVIEYKTKLENTRKSLHKVLIEFDEFKNKVCHSGSLNCETIGKTLTSEPALDGLSNIII